LIRCASLGLVVFFILGSVWLVALLQKDILARFGWVAAVFPCECGFVFELLLEFFHGRVQTAVAESSRLAGVAHATPAGPCAELLSICEDLH
jgi:hypothetical protein